MTIKEAKRALGLKLMVHPSIVGAGIRGTGKQENIVIFLKDQSPKAIQAIPDTFEGHRVTYEISGEIKLK